ncbi:MAG: hypothetical protein B7Y26_04565 [Hydrogenophilales bacterium 16-64-46]|nr:MAG: hypothetical protein B7Y26_04565 [Hydrogenophilales bacterium 16-64-46]OZA38853.1 MAG: hypothetical protein B7X87_05325 [Hydrogenophilales bacterium 17-64-34]HQS99508.1 PcfJ domain-containing protein [Thiobacillus sp.]
MTATCNAVRARLWLTTREYGEATEAALLWLHLADGRVLAFRLAAHLLGDDALIPAIVEGIADDARGEVLEVDVPRALLLPIVLYAAPAAPMPALAWGHARHAEARRFAAGLDQGILECLARLDAHRFWSSCRNYNRLVSGEEGRRRQQAVERFPVLAAPILLTAHHATDTCGGKRFAWRDHDDEVVDAALQGRDLAGVLAAHYGVSRSLVRAPVCSEMWGDLGIAHTRMVQLLDRIPAHARPASRAELERGAPYVAALERLVGEPALLELAATLFKPGWAALWTALEARFNPLGNAIDDCRDFLRVAMARALELDANLDGDDATLGHAWLARHGLTSLLDASVRWHRHPRQTAIVPTRDIPVPALFGVLDRNLSIARELLDYDTLADEGDALHHCVASYWDDIAEGDTRIVSLTLPKGGRATAQYDIQQRGDDLHFKLVQLRGPCNADAGYLMELFAQQVEIHLNAPELRPQRVRLGHWRDTVSDTPCRPPALRLDAESERRLSRALAWIAARRNPPLPAGALLFSHITGYAYNRDPALETRLTPGQLLELVREPDNPHDPLAVLVAWQGRKLGYLPRPFNINIARRLDAGEALVCRFARAQPERLPWDRLECVVSGEAV